MFLESERNKVTAPSNVGLTNVENCVARFTDYCPEKFHISTEQWPQV